MHPLKKSLLFIILTLTSSLLPQSSQAQVSPSFSLLPATQTVAPGDPVSIDLTVADISDLGSYQITVSYDPALLTYQNLTQSNFLASTGRTAIPLSPAVNPTNGTITFGAFTFGQVAGPSGTGTLATLSFTAANPGTSALSPTNLIVTDTLSNNISVIGNPSSVIISSPSSPSPTPTVTLYPSPTSGASPTPTTAPNPGSATLTLIGPDQGQIAIPQSWELMLATTEPLSGVDVILTFDPRLLTIDSVDNNLLLPNTPLIDFNNGSGIIRLSQTADPGAPATQSGSLMTIHGTPKTTGPISFTFAYTEGSKADSNTISYLSGNDILATPLNFIFTAFDPAQLILSLTTPSESTLSGHLVQGTLTVSGSTHSAVLTTSASGQTPAHLLPNDFIGELLTFFFKVSGFLRKSIVLTINPGTNYGSLGALVAGDLNDDGQINSLDLALLYDTWGQTGTADFNQDGVINSADHWHLINNFLREDE